MEDTVVNITWIKNSSYNYLHVPEWEGGKLSETAVLPQDGGLGEASNSISSELSAGNHGPGEAAIEADNHEPGAFEGLGSGGPELEHKLFKDSLGFKILDLNCNNGTGEAGDYIPSELCGKHSFGSGAFETLDYNVLGYSYLKQTKKLLVMIKIV